MVARLAPPRLPHLVVEALARVRQVRPEVTLALVGDGPLRPRVEGAVAQHRLEGAVDLLGERNDVADLLVHASCAVHLSTYEGASLAVLEAMAAGLPVVASRLGGMDELVVDGVTGRLVDNEAADIAGAILDVLGRPDGGRKLAERAGTLPERSPGRDGGGDAPGLRGPAGPLTTQRGGVGLNPAPSVVDGVRSNTPTPGWRQRQTLREEGAQSHGTHAVSRATEPPGRPSRSMTWRTHDASTDRACDLGGHHVAGDAGAGPGHPGVCGDRDGRPPQCDRPARPAQRRHHGHRRRPLRRHRPQRGESGRIPAIKAASPGVKVLVYKDMSSTRSYAVRNGVDDAKLPTGVGYAVAERTHPEWFLTTTAGARVEWAGYPGHWWMDIGNDSYIDAWTASVSAELAAGGWDGVMVDNTMNTPEYYLPGDSILAKYPNDASYAAATDHFLAVAGPRLRSGGFSVIPNLGGNFVDLTTYRRWVGYASGALREHFGRWGSDGNGQILTDWAWSHQLEQQEIVQGLGRTFLAVPYARTTDVGFQRYVRSSFLLGWDGGSSSLLFTPPAAGVDPFAQGWTTDIGTPTAARTAVGIGWKRSYSDGTVVVNPSSTGTVTIPLGAAHTLPDGSTASQVTLGPASGLTLARVAPASAPAPTTTTSASAPVPTTTAPAPAPAPTPTTAAPALAPATSAPAAAPAPAPATTTAVAPAPAPVAPSASAVASTPAPVGTVRASTAAPSAPGYLVLGSDGEVYAYGASRSLGSLPALGIRNNRAITLSSTPSGQGYWILGADGGIFTFGDAQFLGSVPGLGLRGVSAIDLQPTPSGHGYWILGADGGIFTFGDAQFYGSVPGLGIKNKAAKVAPTPSGRGYWVLGADGGIFSFGDADFFGSLPGINVQNTSIALAATPTGRGYWILGADGGIFSFGDASFHGSLPGLGVTTPGIQFRPTRSGAGYYISLDPRRRLRLRGRGGPRIAGRAQHPGPGPDGQRLSTSR